MIVKRKKSKSRIAAWVVIAAAWIALGVFSVNYFMNNGGSVGPVVNNPAGALVTDGDTTLVDETPIEEDTLANYIVPANHPRYIYLPSVGVGKTRVVPLGVVADTGQLDAPVSIHDAGWYTGSAKPGESNEGAVLIDGHNAGPTIGGVFLKLSQVKIGDQITIERGDGKTFTYEVKYVQDMDREYLNDVNNPNGMSRMMDSYEDGKQGLNIITCAGQWDFNNKTYNQRTVVRAVQV